MNVNIFKVRLYLKRLINNLLSAKNTEVKKLIHHSDDTMFNNVNYVINSSVIIHFSKDGKDYYFRECLCHLPLREHLINAIDDYCSNITQIDNSDELRISIQNDLADKTNYKRYVNNIPQIYDTNLIEILSGEYDNYAYVGLPSFTSIASHEEFLRFLQYSCCILSIYSSNSNVKYGWLENSNANKQISTYLLARLLGIEELIPKVELCELNISGKKRIGTLMDKAEGKTPAYVLPEKRKMIKKESFLRDLSNLEYLDALCYQLDHRLDNYNVVYDERGFAETVVAFDNDASRTFFPFPSMPRSTYAGASSVVRNGLVNRPYIDDDFAQHIQQLTEEELKKELSSYLTKFQIKALWRRIKILKDAIQKTKTVNKDFLVCGSQWKNIDESMELDEIRYGKTYYNIYLNDTVMLDRASDFKNRKICI